MIGKAAERTWRSGTAPTAASGEIFTETKQFTSLQESEQSWLPAEVFLVQKVPLYRC